MKKMILLTLMATVGHLFGQSILFNADLGGANEVPPNNSTYYGSGSFSLNGSTLDFTILFLVPNFTFAPTSAGIYGPALPGQNGSLILDLGTYYESFNPPQKFYRLTTTLLDQQINDLNAGLWYVNLTSDLYPGGELRGQIVAVPEPSIWALMLLGGGGVWMVERRCRRSVNSRVA